MNELKIKTFCVLLLQNILNPKYSNTSFPIFIKFPNISPINLCRDGLLFRLDMFLIYIFPN